MFFSSCNNKELKKDTDQNQETLIEQNYLDTVHVFVGFKGREIPGLYKWDFNDSIPHGNEVNFITNMFNDLNIKYEFIENYINEIKMIIRSGLKSQYIQKQENLNFIKGKIVNSLNFKYNHSNKARFYCEFDEFSENMVYNQLIKSTLLKLNRISKSHYNRSNILQLLHHFDPVNESSDFISDFKKVSGNNRLFLTYRNY